MALISVPAWPIPTQNTKLTIGMPQNTGFMLPNTPTTVQNSQVTPAPKRPSMLSAIAKAMYQPSGGLGDSATRETVSVMRSRVLSPFGAASNGLTSVAMAIG